jgi:soluble lytic murein transglycosylase
MKEEVTMKKKQLPMSALIVFPLFLLFFLIVSQRAHADFYMYVDEEGVTHITNVPTSSKYKWVMKETGSDPWEANSLEGIINGASEKWGVDPVLVRAVIKAESNFNPDAVSRAGARGLMQLMPETALLMGVKDINDPAENVEGGVRYLRKLLKSFHWDVTLALAAYNAGEAAVRKHGGIPPFTETVNFVKRVLSNWKSYRSSSR